MTVVAAMVEAADALLAALDVVIRDKQQLTPACGELLAPRAHAGLDDDGMALRGTGHGERAARRQELASIIESAHLVGMGIKVVAFVRDDCVIVPAVPVPEYHLHKFVGPVVTTVVLHRFDTAHVQGFVIVDGSHHVPSCTAFRHEIHGLEQTGNMKRLVVRRRTGSSKAEIGRRRSHGHQTHHGIHLHATDAVANRVGMVTAEEVRHG